MDSDDSESAPMDLDLTAPEKDLGLDGHPATTPPSPLNIDAPEKDLGMDGHPATTPPTDHDLDTRKTSDKKQCSTNQTTPGENKDYTVSSMEMTSGEKKDQCSNGG